jgi:MFS family permease
MSSTSSIKPTFILTEACRLFYSRAVPIGIIVIVGCVLNKLFYEPLHQDYVNYTTQVEITEENAIESLLISYKVTLFSLFLTAVSISGVTAVSLPDKGKHREIFGMLLFGVTLGTIPVFFILLLVTIVSSWGFLLLLLPGIALLTCTCLAIPYCLDYYRKKAKENIGAPLLALLGVFFAPMFIARTFIRAKKHFWKLLPLVLFALFLFGIISAPFILPSLQSALNGTGLPADYWLNQDPIATAFGFFFNVIFAFIPVIFVAAYKAVNEVENI